MKILNRLALARPMVLCGVLLFFYSAFRAPYSAFGQTLTTVSDTLRNADGTLASGKLRIFWKNFAFTESGATYAIGAGNKEITVTAGVVSVQLYPTANSIPSGITYRVEYDLTSGSAIEYWSIPTTGPATIGSVRTPVGVSPTPAGTVTSVALTMPAGFTVTGSPITTNGTLSVGGILAVTAGGTGAAPGADDQLLVSDSISLTTWRAVPNCAGATTDKLLYNTATNTFSCGADQTGAGGTNHNLLSATHLDTTAAAVARGDLIIGQAVTPSWQRLALGGAATFLRSNGTDALWAAIADSDLPVSISRDTESPAAGDITGSLSGGYQIGPGAIVDGDINASGITTRSKLPSPLVYEDEVNVFTVAGGLTLDNQLALRLREATVNGINFIEHRATAAITISSTYTWPVAALGFLRSSAVGDLSLAAASGTGACPANQFQTGDNDNAAPSCAQPAFSNLSGAATLAQLPFGAANQLIKTNAGATAQEHATLAAGSSGTDFAVAFGVGTITLNLPAASGANTGKLSSADWITFNNSVDSVSGTAGEITSSAGQTPVISLPATLSTAKTVSGGWTFNTAATLFQGPAAALRVDLENPDAPAEDSFADSPELQITGIRDSLAGAGVTREEVNWKLLADVTAVAGTSTLLFQSRIGAAAFANRLTVSDASVVTATSFAGALTGNASTASALLANGGNCAGNNFALGVDAAGVAECAQPAFSNLSGGATLAQLPFGTANQILGTNAGATAQEHNTLGTGTSGTDFAIAHAANSVTFNLPDASATARGAVTTGTQTFAGAKTLASPTLTGTVTVDRRLEFTEAAGDPACAAGDFWISVTSTTNVLRKCQNGTLSNLDTGGSGGHTITVNGSALASATAADLDDATPAAPSDGVNVRWQKDALDPTNISSNLQFATGALAGALSTAAQTIAGAKTLTGALKADEVTVTQEDDGIGVTSTDGVILQNTTAAAAAAQQQSPRLRLTGQGWKTDPTAASQTVDWAMENLPVEGAAAPSTNLLFRSQVNAGGYTTRASLTSAGVFDAATLTESGNAVPNVTDNLSVFAPTTSAQLLGVLSDETGTGLAVFGTNPTISSSLTQDGDAADAGYLRLQNAATIAWEAAPAGVDVTLTVNASEVLESSAPISATTGFQIGGVAATGSLLKGNGTNYVALAIGGANTFLGSNGTDASWTGASPSGAVLGTGRTLTGGAGIAAIGDLSADRTISTASDETDFLAVAALTCGAATKGKLSVPTQNLTFCDNQATPVLQTAVNQTRTLTGGTGIAAIGDLSADRTIAADFTEYTAVTFLANADTTWTFDTAGATSPVFSFTGSNINVSTGTLQEGGVAVSLPARTETQTNKTLDAEATGNVITQPKKLWIPAATCVAATATNNWDDDPAVAEPTAACVAGTVITKGVSDFLDAATNAFQTHIALTSDFTGNIDLRFVWLTSVTANNVVWQAQTICVATGAAETDDPAFNAASTVTDTAAGTANALNEAVITTLTITGCAAGELLHLRVLRDPANASDTLAATARLYGVEVTLRRAM